MSNPSIVPAQGRLETQTPVQNREYDVIVRELCGYHDYHWLSARVITDYQRGYHLSWEFRGGGTTRPAAPPVTQS